MLNYRVFKGFPGLNLKPRISQEAYERCITKHKEIANTLATMLSGIERRHINFVDGN